MIRTWFLSVTLAGLLWAFAPLSFAQTAESERAPVQSNTPQASIRVESDLVIVRAMVVDRKVWNRGLTEAKERCVHAEEEVLSRLPATVPYFPRDCAGVFVRSLKVNDFRVFVDGVEQRIEAATAATSGVGVRDNQGQHIEFSETPVGKWSSSDHRVPGYLYGDEIGNRYDIAFAPNDSARSGCHKIKVKVDRRDWIVAAREEYCGTESPSDTLNGTAFGRLMEAELPSDKPEDILVSLQAAAFRARKGRGLVRVTMEFPWRSLNRRWDKDGVMNATIGTLGMVRGQDGTLVERFSDLACCRPYSTAQVWGPEQAILELGLSANPMLSNKFGQAMLPARYERELELAPGEYDLLVVLSDGESFGRAEAHLNIENYDGKELALSSVMLCKRFRDAHVAAVETAAANIAPQYVPMVSKDIQVTPAGDTTFRPGEPLIPYFEIYPPQAGARSVGGIEAHLRIVDAKTSAVVKDFPPVDAATYIQPGSTTIPIAREVPIAALAKGAYRLEVQATDSAGHSTLWRAANFTVE